MRFLCLHGMGANSQVLEVQIAAVRNHLAGHHEFVFVDGLESCDPDLQVEAYFEGPYLCYYTTPSPAQMHEAYALINEVILDEGPFDGVIGFSQGAALATSMLLQHAKDHPTAEPLFSVAILLCASLPFDLNSSLRKQSAVAAAVDPKGYPVGLEDDPLIYQRYDPCTTTTRLKIPTLHVIGKQDPFRKQSESLVALYSEDAISIMHDGGHLIPKDRYFTAKLVRSLEGMIARVQHYQ